MSSPGSQATEKRFADYFVICGLDLKSGLEPDQLAGDSLHCTPLDRPYRSKVLAHYPDNVPWNPFDASAVGMLCLPRGLSFCTQKHPREPLFHSFIITRENGSRTYGQAYFFYEEVTDPQICAAMQTLQAMHLTELSSSTKALPIRNLSDSVGSRSLPRSFKIGNVRNQSTSGGSLYDLTKDSLYATKCICLITALPFVVACHKFLANLYTLFKDGAKVSTIESYVYHILHEVPLPPPGRSLKFDCAGKEILCQRPGSMELPLCEYSFQEFFSILGVENAIQLFNCALLEHQILLCSEDYHRLMLIAECVTTLLFPFMWQHVYVPILPASLQHFLDAPIPYIMGLHHNAATAADSHITVPGEADLCFVSIDNQEVVMPEDIPKLPFYNEIIAEVNDALSKFGVTLHGISLDRNLNERRSPRSLSSPRYYHTTQPHRRKHSWSMDSGDSGVSSNESSARSSYSSLSAPQTQQILLHSEAMQRITAIAKRTGVLNSLEDLSKPSRRLDPEGNSHSMSRNQEELHEYIDILKLNNHIREIFLNRFAHMFKSYEHFIIPPGQHGMEQWLSTRETMQNFDKTTFLCDQPEPHLPFLSRFIETQMFASLIDKKVITQWMEPDSYLMVFDSRIRDCVARSQLFLYERCTTHNIAEQLLEERLKKAHISAPSVKDGVQQQHHRHQHPSHHNQQHRGSEQDPSSPNQDKGRHTSSSSSSPSRGVFPMLDAAALNKSKKRTNAQIRRKDRLHQQQEHLRLSAEQRQKFTQDPRNKMKHPKLSDVSPAIIAQTNWKFVEALLNECTTKTKRMLVEKMGQEAVDLGHVTASLTGVEENTLIAGLCDLLERVWRHGLLKKQGKSALWSHLMSYLQMEEGKTTGKPIDPHFLTPARPVTNPHFGFPELILTFKTGSFSAIVNQLAAFDLSTFSALDAEPAGSRQSREKKVRSPDLPGLKPLPVSLVDDVRTIQEITEIKTDIGYARAWVRLALEKKLLSKHLKKLLSNQELLRSLYRRYGFVRCDDEKEQFLYHLLSLNAVDYSCFTNTFASTTISYRVIIFPSRKMNASTTSANAWICLAGTLGETKAVPIAKHLPEIVFRHKNLGILTTLRIGHDNSGMSPKWMVEHVLVRNETTGHTYKFPCGRWLGKGVDDGSTERLLVAEKLPLDVDNEALMETCRTPPRCRSPSTPRRSNERKLSVPKIQEMLGDAVNNIVKFFHKPEKERGSLTRLLCGEMGLVYCLEQVFLYGFKATVLFFRQVYLWDFLVKMCQYFESELHEFRIEDPLDDNPHEHVVVMRDYCKLVDRIDKATYTVGKDGKFQLFICFAVRDHLLHRLVLHMATAPVTATMYEERSFLRDPNLVTFLVQILESLAEFTIVLETSLTKGIE